MTASKENASPTRTRLLSFGAFAMFIVITNWSLTQWLAAKLVYHPALGARGFMGLYQPFAWFDWLFKWYEYAQEPFNIAMLVCMGSTVVGLFTVVLFIGYRTRSARQHESLHGTAHWADANEIRDSGLLPRNGEKGEGVYVGGWLDTGRK